MKNYSDQTDKETRLLRALQEYEERNSALPAEGHEERFMTRLSYMKDKRKKRRSYIRFVAWASSAAAVLLFMVFLTVRELGKQDREEQAMALVQKDPQILYAEEFFRKKLSEAPLPVANGDQNISKFISNLNYLESQYKVLEKAWQDNPGNETVLEAMIENYKYRLEIVQVMQRYIQIKNNSNTESQSHESSTDL